MRAILTYHSIDNTGSIVSVTPESFRSHVAWLASGVVRVVSLTELASLGDDVDAVALTFDDALASVATEAAPLLCSHALPATVFVVTGHVGADNRWNAAGDPGIPVQPVLDWRALEHLQTHGFAVGGHTRHHRHLPRCGDAELMDEIAGCADDIAAALGQSPTAFAYPYGDFDARVVRAASEHFALCCTTAFRPWRAMDRPHLIPRLDAWYFRDASHLRRWGTASFRRNIALRHSLRRIRRVFR
jgi:peptidoglycan/xylan/chitin deacetylase (PgdA/CDA1 family)